MHDTREPKTSVFRMFHCVLQLYPYKLQSFQQLLPDDAAKRMEFANWALSELEENPQWLISILWTDEVHFSLHGTVNTHNCRMWLKENPHAYTEDPYTHHISLLGVVLLWKLLWVPFSLKNLVQD